MHRACKGRNATVRKGTLRLCRGIRGTIRRPLDAHPCRALREAAGFRPGGSSGARDSCFASDSARDRCRREQSRAHSVDDGGCPAGLLRSALADEGGS